jgi:hypothetical protein
VNEFCAQRRIRTSLVGDCMAPFLLQNDIIIVGYALQTCAMWAL